MMLSRIPLRFTKGRSKVTINKEVIENIVKKPKFIANSVSHCATDDDDSTEEIPASFVAIFSSETGPDLSKAAIYLGLTSGSILSGFSIGCFLAAREDRLWLTSAISAVVAKKIWESIEMGVIPGLVGTSLLGYSSYKFWTKEEKYDLKVSQSH